MLATISVSRRLKRLSILFLILTIMICAFGCVDVYAGKRPSSYPNTKWVSQDPSIYFIVYDGYMMKAWYMKDDEYQQIDISFDFGPGVKFSLMGTCSQEVLLPSYPPEDVYTPGELLARGECRFFKDKLLVKLETPNKLFDDSVKEIVFIRENLPPGTTPNYTLEPSTT